MLARIWNAAADRGLLPEGANPCRLVVKNRERPRERFLSEAEFRRLGRILAEAETRPGVSVHAIAAIRLLLLTGCRKNEILTLRWSDVDLRARELRLADSKTGARVVPLSPEAAAVLAGIPRIDGNPHVIPGKVPGAPLHNLDNLWRRLPRPRRARGRAAPRLPALVRVPGARTRRGAHDDRPAARSRQGGDHRAVRAPGAGFGPPVRSAGVREHRRRRARRRVARRRRRSLGGASALTRPASCCRPLCYPSPEPAMSSPDLQPPPRTGLRRFLSPDVAVLTMLAVVITVSAGLAAGAVAGHFALSAEVRQTHARIDHVSNTLAARIDETNTRIDDTNVRIDALTADMNTRFDRMDAKMEAGFDRMEARFDRMFTLLQGTLQDHSRRLDAIERRLAETVPQSGQDATP